MDTETYIRVATCMTLIAFGLNALVFVFYTFTAPWFKYSVGWQVWGLLLALLLALSVSVLRIAIGAFPYYKELALVTLGLLIFSIAFIGYGIYTARMKSYRRSKFIKQQKESRSQ